MTATVFAGYVTGVTTIAAWFPDRKGFATGLVVMGFGMGGFVMSKIFAPLAMEVANQQASEFATLAASWQRSASCWSSLHCSVWLVIQGR